MSNHNVLVLPIPADAWDKAIAWVKIKKRTGYTKVPNYTGLNEPLRYETGYVGELTFDAELTRRDIRHIYEVHLDGYGHDAEFTVYRRTGAQLKLDTKTSSKAYGDHLMTPASLFDKHKNVDVYVGIKLVNDIAEVHGWIMRDDLATYPRREFKVLSVACPYVELTDIEELLDDLQNFSVPVGGQLELFKPAHYKNKHNNNEDW